MTAPQRQFPRIRLDRAVRRVPPVKGHADIKLGLESVESWTGQLAAGGDGIDTSTDANLVSRGQILFGKLRPYLAKVWVADRDGGYVGDFLNFEPRPDFEPRFLGYVFRTEEFIERASAESYGSKMPRVEWEQLRLTGVPAPSLDEQRRIADYLDHETAEIDALIAGLKSMSALLEERAKAAIERLFLGHNTVQIRHLAPKRVTGVSVNGATWAAYGNQHGVLKTGAASKGYLDVTENKAVVDTKEIARLDSPLEADRILINRANTPDLVGTAAYVDETYPHLYLSDKLWQIDFRASNEYMYFVLNSRIYRDQVSLASVGASASMHNLSYEDFLSIQVPVPAISTQFEIVESARRISGDSAYLRAGVDQAIALAKERRAALISAAVTGELDVTQKHTPAAEQLEAELAEAR